MPGRLPLSAKPRRIRLTADGQDGALAAAGSKPEPVTARLLLAAVRHVAALPARPAALVPMEQLMLVAVSLVLAPKLAVVAS